MTRTASPPLAPQVPRSGPRFQGQETPAGPQASAAIVSGPFAGPVSEHLLELASDEILEGNLRQESRGVGRYRRPWVETPSSDLLLRRTLEDILLEQLRHREELSAFEVPKERREDRGGSP